MSVSWYMFVFPDWRIDNFCSIESLQIINNHVKHLYDTKSTVENYKKERLLQTLLLLNKFKNTYIVLEIMIVCVLYIVCIINHNTRALKEV